MHYNKVVIYRFHVFLYLLAKVKLDLRARFKIELLEFIIMFVEHGSNFILSQTKPVFSLLIFFEGMVADIWRKDFLHRDQWQLHLLFWLCFL